MKKIAILVFITIVFISCNFKRGERILIPYDVKKLEIPAIASDDILINHSAFSLLYNIRHKQSIWVAYELTSDETNKRFDRTDKFKPDPNLLKYTKNESDYKYSGFDRGHLAPASDMGWSEFSMEESFYYSNISPQAPGFNRGIWKRLEEQCRSWAVENSSVYIVTGPVISDGLNTLGSNRISVPKYYYKVVLDYNEPNLKGIGFILPNSKSGDQLKYFAVSIDSVEKFTGIDFFPLLPDNQEESIEKTLCVSCWTWGNIEEQGAIGEGAIQCNGTTLKGERCKNKTLNPSGFCYHHLDQQNTAPPVESIRPNRTSSVQCSGTTRAGNRCRRMTLSPSGRCYQHEGN